jgi:serine/threonine protein phosphatase PrpC
MKVVTLTQQGGSKKNEDNILVSDRVYGVFDGATSFVSMPVKSEYTGGFLASKIAAQTFGEGFASLRDAAIVANNRIWDAMMQAGVDTSDKLSLWSTSLCVVKLHEKSFEWAQIGDSILVVIFRDGSYKILVEEYDHDERDLSEWKRRVEAGETQVFESMKEEFFYDTRRGMNEPNGYGILNGEEVFEEYLLEGEESLEDVAHILLFSDGMFFPSEDPSTPDDIERIVQTFLKYGVEGWHGAIRAEEESDPDCKKYPRLKKSDDASVIAISF